MITRPGGCVKELRFKCEDCGVIHTIKYDKEDLTFTHGEEVLLILNRSEAHSLMLYLQEHLGYNKVEVTEPKMWLCGCGKYHMKDYICTQI